MKCGLLILILLVGLLGCNKPAAPPPGTASEVKTTAAQVYPHSDEFKNTKLHGSFYVQDKFVCAKCHGSDFRGGNTKKACQTCHGERFPHPPGWAHPKTHGGYFAGLNEDARKTCVQCHQTDASASGVACTTCHKAFPHIANPVPDEWKYGHDGSGKYPENKCLLCHADLKANTPTLENGCRDCHADDGNLEVHFVKPTPSPAPDSKEVTPKAESAIRPHASKKVESPRKPSSQKRPH